MGERVFPWVKAKLIVLLWGGYLLDPAPHAHFGDMVTVKSLDIILVDCPGAAFYVVLKDLEPGSF